MTLELPWNTATLFMIAPISIIAKPSHAMRGVARRHRSRVDEQKYSTAISKKIIQ